MRYTNKINRLLLFLWHLSFQLQIYTSTLADFMVAITLENSNIVDSPLIFSLAAEGVKAYMCTMKNLLV